MLQFEIAPDFSMTPTAQVEAVLKGGCRWIIAPSSLQPAEIEGIIEECKAVDAFLTIKNDVDLTDRLRVHGVVLSDCSVDHAAAVREKLGPHAVIGFTAHSAAEILALRGKDIDYAVIPSVGTDTSVEQAIAIASEANAAGNNVHLVAQGDMKLTDIPALLKGGFNGIATTGLIICSPDPTARVEEILKLA
ncbi:MAG: thiamine phosphate synthase [Muribaculaceae bacterium]|nr:thiamine phosphate synthase [Muribaculaceae bacterium]